MDNRKDAPRPELAINTPDSRGDGRLNNNAKYRLRPDEVDVVNNYRRIINEAQRAGVDAKDIKHGWLKSKEASIFFKNPLYDDGLLNMDKVAKSFQKIVDGLSLKKKTKLTSVKSNNQKALKVTISDSHVGMNPKEGVFEYEYNDVVYKESLDKVFGSIIKEFNTHKTFEHLFLDDLGDLADGWSGYTTRGGHKLPQNLTNQEVFEVCIDGKVNLIKKIIDSKVAKKITVRCIVNDNHSGDFGHLIALGVKKIINTIYKKSVVDIDIITGFMEHRVYGDHCFILTHGKDKANMRSGLPIHLNDKASRFIRDYIDYYAIDSKYIHVEKGDLHQIGYQKIKKFDYRNFMSFAPPSAWIQHNFGDSYSGYSIQVIPKYGEEISHTDYFLNYKKQ
jgi:hypothetical protein